MEKIDMEMIDLHYWNLLNNLIYSILIFMMVFRIGII